MTVDNNKEFLVGSREDSSRSAYDQAVTEGMVDPRFTTLQDFQKSSDFHKIMPTRIGPFFEVNLPALQGE